MRMPRVVVVVVIAVITSGTAATAVTGCQTMRPFGNAIAGNPTTRRAAANDPADPPKTGDPADARVKKTDERTLYDRLGGEPAIAAVVDDLVARASANSNLNFTRQGTSHEWQPTPQNVAILKQRLVQFLGTATGGPQRYEGEDMRTAHRGMQITDAEFDAFLADLRRSLQQANVGAREQQELMELLQSTRGPLVEPHAPIAPR